MTQGELQGNPHCPSCRSKMDCYTALTGSTGPEPGDVTLCIVCAEVLRFTRDDDGSYGLESVPAEELPDLYAQAPMLIAARAALSQLHRERTIQ